MNGQESPPGRWWYGLAAVIFVAGWVIFGVVLWKSLSGIGEELQQAVVPGRVELNLAKPGKYTIFHEYESVVSSRIYSMSQDVSGLQCSLENKTTGAPVKLSRSFANTRYSLGGRSGVSFLDFRIEQPGTYVLSAAYAEGEEGPEVVLAVGQGMGLRIVTGVLGSLAAVFGCIGLSVAIAVYVGVKRYRAGERARTAGS